MSKLLKSIGKEVLFLLAGIIAFYVGIIADYAAAGFLAFILLVIGGVFFERYLEQRSQEKLKTAQKAKAHFS